ncbi:aspartate/glutamate racemase family protein [Flavobacterium soyangense]|uniref:Amino acid racemase n=1 Tax=Flavobacterium soyangense TaxID=2023265 RepID=A0A930UEX9_9FLAO|nr:amino acid racemase [Flavobacterium soyangense]MBF2709529.1 amino acid racemase [Flavobacterium soyangense]
MKKIGLVGGISWVSTMDYYKFINEGINSKLGGLNFAECIIYSLNFGDIQEKSWENSFELLLNACESLKRSKVDAIVLCANTAHLFADKLQEKIGLPIIHIGSETAKAINKQEFTKVGLLGTKFTMEMGFYKNKLEEYGLKVLIPEKQETRDYIQYTVKEELGIGFINPETKKKYIEIVNELIQDGAECIILGCTEIPMLISQSDFEIPTFDTTKIHSQAIVDYMLSTHK